MPISPAAVDRLFSEFEQARGQRLNFEVHWQEAAELIYPIASDFTMTASPGQLKRSRIMDGTGEQANQILAAGLFALLTNPSQPFFEVSTNDRRLNAEFAIADWLQETTEIMNHEVQLPVTNFTAASTECYLEYGAFGNLQMFVSQHPLQRNLLFQSMPLSETYFLESHYGSVSHLFRLYCRTAAQLVEEFGEANVSSEVLKDYEDKQKAGTGSFEILHVVRPVDTRKDILPPREFRRFKYVSVYIEKTSKHVLKEKGYYEKPFAVARFYKAANEIYGRGPGFAALSDVKMLQEIYITTLSGAQKRIDPPMQMPDDGYLAPLDVSPGAVNFYQSGMQDRVEAIPTIGDPGLGEELAGGVRARIYEAFYANQLQLNIGPQMTATEVLQRVEQQMRMLGPIVGRLQNEFLSPMLRRCFGLLKRMGKIPEPPPQLVDAGNVLTLVYTTPMARAQDQLAANNLTRTVQVLEPFFNMNQETGDNFNTDQIAQGIGEVFSVPKRFYNSPAKRDAIRQQRMEAIQAQQMAQNLRDGGQGLQNIANAQQALDK